MQGESIADVAISKRPLLFTVWTQLRLRSHQNFYEIFTRKQGRTPLIRAPIGFYAKVRLFKARFEGEAAIF